MHRILTVAALAVAASIAVSGLAACGAPTSDNSGWPESSLAVPTRPQRPEGVTFHTEQGVSGTVVVGEFKIGPIVVMSMDRLKAQRTTVQILQYARSEYPDARSTTRSAAKSMACALCQPVGVPS